MISVASPRTNKLRPWSRTKKRTLRFAAFSTRSTLPNQKPLAAAAGAARASNAVRTVIHAVRTTVATSRYMREKQLQTNCDSRATFDQTECPRYRHANQNYREFLHGQHQSRKPGRRTRWRRDDPHHLGAYQAEADPALSGH